MKEKFTEIYEGRHWRGESRSGVGSSLAATRHLRVALRELIEDLGVSSMLDLPCGDWNWMKHVDLTGVSYIGADIVESLVGANQAKYGADFRVLDAVNDPLPCVDLVWCRDMMIHLPAELVVRCLRNIAASGSRYAALTTFPGRNENRDVPVGGLRYINLEEAPFHLPRPVMVLNERSPLGKGRFRDKSMGVWECEALIEGLKI